MEVVHDRPIVCPAGQAHAPTGRELEHDRVQRCGPKGMQIKEPFGLYRCSNHDLCFATCGTSQDFCEELFTSCMFKYAARLAAATEEACQKQANGMSGMTRMFGGGFHLTRSADPERQAGRVRLLPPPRTRRRGGSPIWSTCNTPPRAGRGDEQGRRRRQIQGARAGRGVLQDDKKVRQLDEGVDVCLGQ